MGSRAQTLRQLRGGRPTPDPPRLQRHFIAGADPHVADTRGWLNVPLNRRESTRPTGPVVSVGVGVCRTETARAAERTVAEPATAPIAAQIGGTGDRFAVVRV